MPRVVDAALGPQDLSWGLVRGWGRSRLSSAGGAALDWAVDRFEGLLGRDWLERQYARHRKIPDLFIVDPVGRFKFPQLLALAARLERFASVTSFAPVLSVLRATPDDEAWAHAVLQLEVGRLGVAQNANVMFEPRIGTATTSRADVRLRWPSVDMLVEVTTVWRAQLDREWEAFEAPIRARLELLADELQLAITAALTDHPDQATAHAWLDQLVAEATAAARLRIAAVKEADWIRVDFEPAAEHQGLRSYEGAPLYRDGFHRTRRVLRDKIGQMVGGEKVWLRVDERDGLFMFTEWARAALHDGVAQITAAVRDVVATSANVGHIAGVVLSSGLQHNLGNTLNETAAIDGAVLMRRQVASHLSRTTAVINTQDQPTSALNPWASGYDREAAWLDQDLAEHGLAPFEALYS